MTNNPQTDAHMEKPMSDEEELLPLYYVQDESRGYIGNSPVWWGLYNQGYTAYLSGAKRFTHEEAVAVVSRADDLIMYSCDEIDKRLHLVFDSQDFHRLGTDEPCGWRGGYAARTNPRTLAMEEALRALEEVQSEAQFVSAKVNRAVLSLTKALGR